LHRRIFQLLLNLCLCISGSIKITHMIAICDFTNINLCVYQAHINHRHVQNAANLTTEYLKEEKQSPRLAKAAPATAPDPRAHMADNQRGVGVNADRGTQQAATSLPPTPWSGSAEGAAAFGQQPPPQAAMYQRMVGAAAYQSAATSRTNLITVPIQDTSEPPPNYYPQSYAGQQFSQPPPPTQTQYAAQQYYQYQSQTYQGAAVVPPPQRVSQYEQPPYQGQWQHPPATANSFYR
jgi:hypothetical protein